MRIWILISSAFASLAQGSRCFFPHAWHGSYFHLGFSSPLDLENSTLSEKGRCVESFGSHYVMEDQDRGERCWRCMTIFRKHHNVLQYKESYCETYFDTFESLCENIAGDSPMYSMFRREAEPVRCPFKGPFSFSYSKGGSGLNTCSYPRSYLDSCTDHHRLQLDFQACTDVQGSESVAEQLQCLGHWREGSKHYMVAQMDRQHVYSDEAKYRCFVYQKVGKGDNRTVQMAQSLSASCRGLWSPQEGYRTFQMEKVASPSPTCTFPPSLSLHRTWSSLDSSVRLHLNSGERSVRLTNLGERRHPEDSHLACHTLVSRETARDATTTRDTTTLVAFVKSGCDSGFVCLQLEEEAEGVMSLRMGGKARSPTEACSSLYFSPEMVKAVMLVGRPYSTTTSCPMSGRYLISPTTSLHLLHTSPCTSPTSSMESGCGTSSLVVESRCTTSPPTRTEHQCSHHWSRGGVTHVLLSSPSSPHLLCLSYSDTSGHLSPHSCGGGRQLGDSSFTISHSSPCVQTLLSSSLSSQATPPHSPSLLILLLLLLPLASS